MSSPSSSARRPPENGRWDEVGTKLSLWPFKISIHSSCLSVIWICCMANIPILAWCSSSARSWYASSVVVPLKLRWDDKAGEFFCLFTSFFTSNEGFLFELDECRHKRSANHQWQKTVAPQRAAVPGSMGNWFVSYTEEVGAPKIGGWEENLLSWHEIGNNNRRHRMPPVGSIGL